MEELSGPVRAVADALLQTFLRLLGGNLVGLYLYGALTFPDSRDAIGDIDFHVFVRHRFDAAIREAALRALREVGAAAEADGLDLDGYIICLADTGAITPPHQLWPLRRVPVDAAWALHCAHVRAGRYIRLHGPDPAEIYPEPSWPQVEAALWEEVRFVEGVLDEAPAYAILNACRLLYSFTTHDVVVSKRGAAAWARERIGPRWHPLIDAALTAYKDGDFSLERIREAGDVDALIDLLWNRIADIRRA